MDQSPLVKEQIDAGARFLAEFEKAFPVTAAFWHKANEGEPWYLYVTSDALSDLKKRSAYGEVLRIIGDMRDPNFNLFRVKLVKPSDPLAKAALDFRERFPGQVPVRVRVGDFGAASADEVYIYPTMTPVN